MDETDVKSCSNCKRDIPSVNFTIHSLHCSRNIRVCPVCKEPVPAADLVQHHNLLHKLVPCKQCGEGVCGSDLEDHLRDSCALTPGACRYCELELPRHELPPHEAYCGARTQRCDQCGELVMIKYRQLHEQSDHGFIKLEDEPGPEPSWKKYEKPKPVRSPADSSFIPRSPTHQRATTSGTVNGMINQPITTQPTDSILPSIPSNRETPDNLNNPISSQNTNERNISAQRCHLKRTNDKPQINTSVPETSKVNKDFPMEHKRSQGCIKKRPAPPPPAKSRAKPPPEDPVRDAVYWSALSRQQKEERQRQEQSAYNASVGLPPVLSALDKLEKLRKMDALANFASDRQDHSERSSGRVREQPAEPLGQMLGRNNAAGGEINGRNLQPMSPTEFVNRFTRLQMSGEARARDAGAEAGAGAGAAGPRADDRFSDIKRELRELRRGLNEVTAPYNTGNIPANPIRPTAAPVPAPSLPDPSLLPRARSPLRPAADHWQPPEDHWQPSEDHWQPPEDHYRASEDDWEPPEDDWEPHVRQPMSDWPVQDGRTSLPCEFCSQLVPSDDLVQHETGCRPDLAQYVRGSRSQALARARSPPRARAHDTRHGARHYDPDSAEPMIPCEFCMHPCPLHLLMEHQEGCMGAD